MAKWRVFLAECQDEEMRSANGVRKIGDADGSETRDTAAASAEAFDGSGMTGKPLFRRSAERAGNGRRVATATRRLLVLVLGARIRKGLGAPKARWAYLCDEISVREFGNCDPLVRQHFCCRMDGNQPVTIRSNSEHTKHTRGFLPPEDGTMAQGVPHTVALGYGKQDNDEQQQNTTKESSCKEEGRTARLNSNARMQNSHRDQGHEAGSDEEKGRKKGVT